MTRFARSANYFFVNLACFMTLGSGFNSGSSNFGFGCERLFIWF